MLKIENYGYSYDQKEIICDLNAEFFANDIVAVVGPNGAGKTTLLKSLVTINKDYIGKIIFNGFNQLDNLVSYKRKIGYVADEPLLLEYLTGNQYFNFIADIYEVSEKTRKRYIKEYSELFEVTDILNDLIVTYSHGNKQKIAIIAALIHDPEILILDEPFVGLDPKAIINIKSVLTDLSRQGRTIILATHILAMVEDVCNKVLFVNNKKTRLISRDKKNKKSLEEIYMEFINV